MDKLLQTIADYVYDFQIESLEAYHIASLCLADTLGCGILALKFNECTKLLGPLFQGSYCSPGSRIPGTNFSLDPVQGAFNMGVMNRWIDFNDTWLAAEWGHPSDNLAGILSVADYLSQKARLEKKPSLNIKEVLTFLIKAYEIQGSLALLNSFNRVGLDHVILVKVATTAVVTALLGGSKQQICDALSQAWIDTGPLRLYRHAPTTGSRKSWAAGDATSRGVFLAALTLRGEMGYPTALTTSKWGFHDVFFRGSPLQLQHSLGSYVMENILFKVSFPAEFHAQTAVECAIKLHPLIKNRWDEIASIEVKTHESALRIIDKKGPLKNYADRDHCLQYMIAMGLLYGALEADHYTDEFAKKDPRIDALRDKMIVKEHLPFSQDYLDHHKRSIANSLSIQLKDGTVYGPIDIEYPIGHKRRRQESIPFLFKKFKENLKHHFESEKIDSFISIFKDSKQLEEMPVDTFMSLWTAS